MYYEPCYVTMTDKFMSNWGLAKDKIAKYIYVCDNMQEAKIVRDNAKSRSDQAQIKITKTKPYYSEKQYLVMWENKEDSPKWYQEDAFK